MAEDIPLDLGNTARVGQHRSALPDNGTCVDDVLVAADMAMYQSKKKGKNCFTLASDGCPGHDGVCFGDEYHVGSMSSTPSTSNRHRQQSLQGIAGREEIAVVTGFFNELVHIHGASLCDGARTHGAIRVSRAQSP